MRVNRVQNNFKLVARKIDPKLTNNQCQGWTFCQNNNIDDDDDDDDVLDSALQINISRV